ncbi:MAG: hypothetical protein U0527_08020 [Candidatus Eisenbacteria bacterium]
MSATSFEKLSVPKDGELIQIDGPKLKVPSKVILPFIEGDGTGGDIWRASVRVFDAAVEKSIQGRQEGGLVEGVRRHEKAMSFGGNVWLAEERSRRSSSPPPSRSRGR